MHEFSIVQNFVKVADEFARNNNIEHVKFVTIEVGKLMGVIPKYVHEYYPDVSRGTALEGAELRIEEIEPLAFCHKCGETFDPTQTEQKCPECGSNNYEVVQGEQLMVKEMGYQ